MQNWHPAFVHFPIALLLAALVLEILAALSRKESLRHGATCCLVLGAVGGLAAMVTGLQAEETVRHSEAAHEIMETHEKLGIAVFILAAALSIVRLLGWDRTAAARAVFTLALAATVALVLYGGYLGGRMVYEFGVGTSLAAVQAEGSEEASPEPSGHSREPEEEEQAEDDEGDEEEHQAAPARPSSEGPTVHYHGSRPHRH